MKLSLLIVLIAVYAASLTESSRIQRGYDVFDIDEIFRPYVTGNYNLMDFIRLRKLEKWWNNLYPPSEILDASNLSISLIEGTVFDSWSHIELLNLTNNQFHTVPPQIFTKLRNLKKLDMSYNLISILRSDDLQGLSAPTDLLLKGNPLEEIEVNFHCDRAQSSCRKTEIVNPLTKISWFDRVPFHIDQALTDNSTRKLMSDNWKNFYTNPFYIKICGFFSEFITSVKIANQNENLEYCQQINITTQSYLLPLKNLKGTKFTRNWFKIPNNYFHTLDFSSNTISEITPEFLNDLPSSIRAVLLRRNSIREIKKNKINNKSLRLLLLDNNRISKIEEDAFINTDLYSLTLSGNALTDTNFARTLPASLSSLQLDANQITELPEDSFNNLKNLKYLMLNQNRIKHLGGNTFRGLNTLHYIDLSYNSLETIETGTFDQEKLGILKLGNNNIKTLSPGCFKNLERVKLLQLRENKIKEIPAGVFSGMQKAVLQELDLGHNEIDTIEAGAFVNLTINHLVLTVNKISENSIAKGAFHSALIRTLLLNENSFAGIKGEAFDGLQASLVTIGSNIEALKKGAVRYMNGVEELNLSENSLKRIENGSLYGSGNHKLNIILKTAPDIIEGGAFNEA